MKHTIIIRCPNCDSKKVEETIYNHYGYYRCMNCGCHFREDILDKEYMGPAKKKLK